MDWRTFVLAFDRKELSDLRSAVWERENRLSLEEVRSGQHKLNDEELALIRDSKWLEAIRSVRSRTNLSLVAAKQLVDSSR